MGPWERLDVALHQAALLMYVLCNNVFNIVIYVTLFVCIDVCYAFKYYLMDIDETLYGNACLPWYLLVKIVPKSNHR